MTERPDRETADELMYASEIAALIGVKRTTVSGWKRRYGADFPAPAQIDESGRELFRRRDIEEWLSRRGTGDGSPKRGRRPVTSVSRLESRPPSRQRLPGERRGSGRAGGFLAGISDPEAAFEEALALLDVADVLRRKAAVEAEDDSSDRATREHGPPLRTLTSSSLQPCDPRQATSLNELGRATPRDCATSLATWRTRSTRAVQPTM